uniref:Cytochrome P450 n=1 Tax=Plectus sambesii TaxID=2011161 RepID=A0A914VK46_9BILA
MVSWLIIGAATVAFLFYHMYWKRRNLPPGPMPLPLFGNLHNIVFNLPGYSCHTKWHKEYNGVYTYWIGTLPIVSVSDYQLMQETFVKDGDTYTGRKRFDWLSDEFRGGNYGVIETDGPMWREQRRFSLHTLRDFGFGRNIMEEKILDEVREMTAKLRVDLGATGSAPKIDLAGYLDICVGSIINAILFGYRFEGEKLAEFYDMKEMLDNHMRLAGRPEMLLIMTLPWLRHFPPFSWAYHQAMIVNRNKMWDFFGRQVSEHERDFDPTVEPTDYCQAFLKEIYRRKEAGEDEGNFHTKQLFSHCIDLWIAGMETTITTLRWGMLHMIHNSDIQAKIHAEIDENITSDREIQMSDKNILPYTMAAVNEMQRTANILAQNLLHKTTRDTTINGYKIPEGTACAPQICAVLLNPEIFPQPERFDPTRFLNADGSPKKVDELVPFSLGKRQCLGESLARMELFLVFANLLRKFKLSISPGEEPPSLKGQMGVTVQPFSYKCCIEARR